MAEVSVTPSNSVSLSEERRDWSPERRKDRSPPRQGTFKDDKIRGVKDERKRGDGGYRRHDDFGEKREKDRENKRRKSSSPPFRDYRRSPPYKRQNFASQGDRNASDQNRQFRRHGFNRSADFSRQQRSTYDHYAPTFDSSNDHQRSSDTPLLSYKQFILDLEDDISPTQAQKRYEDYKNDFIKSKKMAYFNQYKDEEWFREKYDPILIEPFIARRIKQAQETAQIILEEIKNGSLDCSPCATAAPIAADSGFGTLGNSSKNETDEKVQTVPKYKKAADKHKNPSEEAPKIPSLASDPSRVKKDIFQCMKLAKKLDREKDIRNNLLTESISDEQQERNESAEEQVVIVVGDSQKTPNKYQGIVLLDVLLTYLWRVHGVDYYGATESEMLPRGVRHVRNDKPETSAPELAFEEWSKKVDSFCGSRLNPDTKDPVVTMLRKERSDKAVSDALDAIVRKIRDEKYTWKYGCGVKGCSKVFHGPEYVYKHLKLKHTEVVKDASVKIASEIFLDNFLSDASAVIPSLTDLSSQQGSRDNTQRRRLQDSSEADYIENREQNYPFDRSQRNIRLPFADPERYDPHHARGSEGFDHRFHPEPMDGERYQQQDRADEEGLNRKGEDANRYDRANNDERFHSSGGDDHSRDMIHFDGGIDGGPRVHFPSGSDHNGPSPFDAPPTDSMMYDGFNSVNAPLMRSRSFPHPIPPPMLIPVPGAGPLGPFVPAPPDVAMRMLREHGPRPPIPFFDNFDNPQPFDARYNSSSEFDEDRSDVSLPGHHPGMAPPPHHHHHHHNRRDIMMMMPGSKPFGGALMGDAQKNSHPRELSPLPSSSSRHASTTTGNSNHDPRRMRSYHDLDAPEDEITVIDYRSV